MLFAAFLLLATTGSGKASGGEPAVAIEQLLEEAGGVAQEARLLHTQAQEMGPSVERNDLLSKVCQLIKTALGKYEIASEIAPPSKQLQSEITGLRATLFWCHKSMVIVVPDARPGPAPPGAMDSVETPSALAPAPRASQLISSELTDVQTLLTTLVTLFEARELIEDQIASCGAQMQDVRAVLIATRVGWEKRMAEGKRAIAPSELSALESKRGMLLASIRDRRARVQAQESALRELDPRIKALTLRLEFYRDRAFPDMAAFAQARAGALPEGLVRYVNRQLTSPSFGFTSIAAGREAPAGSVERAKQACKLLNEFSQLQIKADGLARMVADSKAASEGIKKDIEEIRVHQAWLQRKLEVTTLDKALQQDQERLREDLGGLAERREKWQREMLPLQDSLDGLRDRLRDLPSDAVRAVEEWRRKQESLPLTMHEALEVWTRRALSHD